MINDNKKNIKHFDLASIKDPTFLKDLSYTELDVLASDIRKNIIDVTSKYGGHLSSNLGVVELTIALHRSFDFSHDKLIIDVGHQAYTHKILTGRSLDKLRTPEGVSGFLDMKESPYDVFEAGHSSTSISVADGFAIARDLNHEKYDIVALIGDSSIVNGLAFEGLNNISHSNRKVIIVLNDNGMSIGRTVGGLGRFFSRISTSTVYKGTSGAYKKLMYKTKIGKKIHYDTFLVKNYIKRMLVPTTLFDNLGYTYIGPIDGNDIKAVEKAIKRAKRATKPVVIHAKTKKGLGYTPAMQDTSGYWHGTTPFKIETGEPKDMHINYKSWSHIYSELIYDAMKNDTNNVLISPATYVGANLPKVFEDFKDRAFDVGISEEHALTMSGALAIAGKHPIISIYSTFLQRAFDELSHDVARMEADITLAIERAGLVGSDGETHQGIYDESFLINTPNTVVSMASNPYEASILFEESLKKGRGIFALRIPRELFSLKTEFNKIPFDFGKWIIRKESVNKRVAIISFGPIINDLQKSIEEKNLDVTLINALYQKPLDVDMIKNLLSYDKIIIHDAYAIIGGFASSVLVKLNELSYKGEIKIFAIRTEFISRNSINNQQIDENVDVLSIINNL